MYLYTHLCLYTYSFSNGSEYSGYRRLAQFARFFKDAAITRASRHVPFLRIVPSGLLLYRFLDPVPDGQIVERDRSHITIRTVNLRLQNNTKRQSRSTVCGTSSIPCQRNIFSWIVLARFRFDRKIAIGITDPRSDSGSFDSG